ncbi:MAG TPA: DUF4386 family protein [Polyangia bacterium]|nr:DUF4386 family protein [Polyangia bacterium]
MDLYTTTEARRLRLGGAALVTGSLAFVALFGVLARLFDYPRVLARGAAQVLPRLAEGGDTLRAVWLLYAALPGAIVYAGLASRAMLARGGRRVRTVGVAAAVTAGAAMTLGLLRWSTLEWELARAWATAGPAARDTLARAFATSNLVLGKLIGELVGEVALATWFAALAVAHARSGRRALAALGAVAAALVVVAALRNVTPAVSAVAAVDNVTLPAWLLALGVTFFRQGVASERSRLQQRAER